MNLVQELPLYNQILKLTNNMIFAEDQKVKFQSQEELLRIVMPEMILRAKQERNKL